MQNTCFISSLRGLERCQVSPAGLGTALEVGERRKYSDFCSFFLKVKFFNKRRSALVQP